MCPSFGGTPCFPRPALLALQVWEVADRAFKAMEHHAAGADRCRTGPQTAIGCMVLHVTELQQSC